MKILLIAVYVAMTLGLLACEQPAQEPDPKVNSVVTH